MSLPGKPPGNTHSTATYETVRLTKGKMSAFSVTGNDHGSAGGRGRACAGRASTALYVADNQHGLVRVRNSKRETLHCNTATHVQFIRPDGRADLPHLSREC